MNFEVHMNLGFCVKYAQCQSGITAYFIMSIMTCRKSLYCVSFIADKKRSSHNAYLKKFSGRNRLYL